MNLVKSVIGSLIGAAIGVAAHFGIQEAMGQTWIWFPLVIGAVTGIVTLLVGGRSNSNSGRYACGALAGLIAGAGILGADLVPTLLTKNGEYGPIEASDLQQPSTKSSINFNRKKPAADDKLDADENRANDQNSEGEQGDAKAENNADDLGDADANPSNNEINDEQDRDQDRTGDANEDMSRDAQADDNDASDASGQDDNTVDMTSRSRGRNQGINNSEENKSHFAEIIRKQSHQSWISFLLPHIFTGLGMFVAYQLVRGFGSVKPNK